MIVMETNPFMKTSISDLVHTRNEAYKKIALELDLAEERLVEIESMVTALGSGKLSKSVIAPKKLRETLFLIERQLPSNYSLLFEPSEALWPYYSLLAANANFDSMLEDVVVTVSVPLVDGGSVLELNRVHNLPLKVKDGYSVIADISTEYLVADSTRLYFLELFKEDFQDCQVFHHKGEHFYCGLQPMLRADKARSCVMQLYQGQPDPTWCQSRLKHGLVQPFARLYNGSWIFAALTDPVPVVLECPDGRTPTALAGFGVIHLQEGCTITSEEFWYAHTHAGLMEVGIRFGKEWTMDGEDGDEPDPADYDISKFAGDIMFAEDDASVIDAAAAAKQPSTRSVDPTTTSTTTTTTTTTTSTSTTSTRSKDGRKDAVSAGVEIEENESDATTIYRDLIVKLKDSLTHNWVIAKK